MLLLLTTTLLAWPAADSAAATTRILYPMRMDSAHEPSGGFTPPSAWRRRAQAADGASGSAGAGARASSGGGGGGGGGSWEEEAEAHYQWLVVTDGSRGDLLRELVHGGEGGEGGGAGAILVPPTGVAMWMTAARAYELSEYQGVSSGTATIAIAHRRFHHHVSQQQQQQQQHYRSLACYFQHRLFHLSTASPTSVRIPAAAQVRPFEPRVAHARR